MDLQKQFEGRILPITPKVADTWGHLTAHTSLPAIDGLIAASALLFNQKLVTRHVKDFQNVSV